MSTEYFIDPKFKASFIEGHIIYIEVNDFEVYEVEDILKLRRWISENIKEKKLYNLFHFGVGSGISRETREYAAGTSGAELTLGTAVLVRNKAQELIIDYYLKMNKPDRPTKAFFKREDAIEWILKKINKS